LIIGLPVGSPALNEFGQVSFLVETEVAFSRMRNGHPEMARYKRWATQLISEIQDELDEQRLWQKTKESFAFRSQAQQSGRPIILPQALNPMQKPQ
jgi:hypothetical protein